jgi:hypothetical protein
MTLDFAFLADGPGFRLVRSTESVDAHGRTVLAPTSSPEPGTILPATDQQLERLDAEDRSSEIVAIYTPTLLTTGTDTLAADRVTWKGEDYEVFQVQDFMDTAGFCVALARATSGHGREVA